MAVSIFWWMARWKWPSYSYFWHRFNPWAADHVAEGGFRQAEQSSTFGEFFWYNDTDILSDLLREPSRKFGTFCCMSFEDFNYLLNKIEPLIAKKDTKCRKAIPAKERLAIT